MRLRSVLVRCLTSASLILAFCSTAAVATDLSGTIDSDTSLTAAGNPYNLVGSLSIAAGKRLTLGPGVVVVARGNHRIYVHGTLQTDGTGTHPVILRAADAAARGAWEGVYVAAGGQCLWSNTTVKNATTGLTAVGANLQLDNCNLLLCETDGAMAWGSTVLSATGCHFDNNGRHGLCLEGDEATGAVGECHFRRNGQYPVYLKATLAEMLQAGNVYAGNGVQRIGVSCSLTNDITDDDTWIYQGVDYDTSAGAGEHTLTIAAGGQLRIARSVRVRSDGMEVRGALRVFGTEDLRCALLSPRTTAQPGDWAGITFRPGSYGDLNSLDLAHATTGITVDGAEVRVTDCTIRDCQYDGLRVTGGATTYARFDRFFRCGRSGVRLDGPDLAGVVKGCVFRWCGDYPVWALAQNVWLVRNLNVYTDNAIQAVGVSCTLDPDLDGGSHSWVAQGVPLDCTADSLGTVLSVGPAAALVLGPDLVLLSGGVEVWGHLEVRGTSSRQVRFEPANASPAPGDWGGVTLHGATGAVSGARIAWATTGLTLDGCSVPISETTVSSSQYDGLRCQGNSRPVVTTSQFVGNGRHGVLIENTACPNLGDLGSIAITDDGYNRFSGNVGYDVYNATPNTIMAQGNWWPSTDEAAIGARVYDEADDSRRGPVRFMPCAGGTPNTAPVLSWLGSVGYEADGLDPEVGTPQAVFRFRVRYADAEGSPPSFVNLHLAAGDGEVVGSPFAMDRGAQTNYKAGVVYLKNLTLAAGRNYTYWFAAADGELEAVGPPLLPKAGPTVNTGPVLEWVGTDGWTSDGVNPDSGLPGVTAFRYRVRYRDADGDAPAAVLCHVARDGSPVTGSPFTMTMVAGGDPVVGLVYEYARKLTQTGAYTYRFEASDGLQQAEGAAAQETSGPEVSPESGSALIWSLSAIPVTGRMVDVRWNLTSAARVSLRVASLAGRTVAELIADDRRRAGPNSATWNGRSQHGTPVPAGTYLVILECRSGDGNRHQRATTVTLSP